MRENEPRALLPKRAQVVIASLDAAALGISVGSLAAVCVLSATLILVNRGGAEVGPNLGLLSEYFIGYRVTLAGAFVGGGYAFLVGFTGAYSFAKLRDILIRWGLRSAWRRSQRSASRDLLDRLT